MTVKADSKGRLTGAIPGEEYHRKADATGRVVYTPITPRNVIETREVTIEEFEKFFGYKPGVIAADGLHTYQVNTPGYLPHGILAEVFEEPEPGVRVFEDGVSKRKNVLIKIRKEES